MAMNSASASSTKALIILTVVGLLVFTLPTVLVLLVGMIPSFIAYATDRRKEKYKTLSVGCLNFLGTLPLLAMLWTKDHSFDMAFTLFADPFSWLMVLGAAATGWTVFLIAPSVVAMFLSARIEMSVDRLKKRQTKLVEEWGNGVSGNEDKG
jgi:1,4-dihydroxy-2-naphthoate octaprenyltransferase